MGKLGGVLGRGQRELEIGQEQAESDKLPFFLSAYNLGIGPHGASSQAVKCCHPPQ